MELKKGKGKQYKKYRLNHGGQGPHSPRTFAQADGRTERVSTTIIILKYVKRKSVLHNGGCVEKETNYHFNTVIRLGTFRLVRALAVARAKKQLCLVRRKFALSIRKIVHKATEANNLQYLMEK